MEILLNDGGELSSGERIMVLLAWNFWNGSGEIRFADAVRILDGKKSEDVGNAGRGDGGRGNGDGPLARI
jgi:hypothetical protein